MNTKGNKSGMRVFVGPGNTAGNAHYIARSLRRSGVHARSFVYRVHEFGYPVDREIMQFRSQKRKGLVKLINNRFVIRPVNAIIRFLFFVSVFFRYDLFYFISPVTFFHRHYDLPVLKLFGKRMAFFFPGCAEKNPHDSLNVMKYSDCWYCNDVKKQHFCLCNEPRRKKARIRKFEKYADYIFSRPNTSGYLEHPEKAFPMWLMTDSPEEKVLLDKYDDPPLFKLMHFPSHRELKGTKYVEAAVSKLNGQYNIGYVAKRMTNGEVLENLEKGHILIDQFTHIFGLLAIEGMSRGCVVICRLEDWARECYPDIPLVSCNPEDLGEVIKDLLKDPKRMKSIAERSVKWYKENATLEVVGKKMLKLFLA
jgi:glycosyltransferase involved in cell wall biosynthesis